MSTFSGLSTALSSLTAQRQALEVSGQNVANANTVGYTRQRADLAPVESQTAPSLFSGGLTSGTGVRVGGVARLGDIFLDARVRSETGSAAFSAARASTYARLESTVAEPTDQGVSHALTTFWAGWQDVGNSPDSDSARAVLLQSATALADRISSGYAAVSTQWSQTRTELDTAVVELNSAASGVAQLNDQIRGVLASGGSANELMDQRDLLVTSLAGMIGASAVPQEDGTVDVMVSGNALVRGRTAHAIEVAPGSARGLADAGAGVALRWAGSTTPVGSGSGRVMALVSALAPASDGGVLAGAAASYDAVARGLVDQVNTVHRGAFTVAGTPGGDFFATTGPSAAQHLRVAVPSTSAVAVAGARADGTPKGALDGSVADTMAALGASASGPDARWSAFVVDLGVTSRSASQRAVVTESTRATAEKLQLSATSVDIDEESVNMLAYQRAYEGAARVLTAIDQMLDTLINRTGLVGR
jgi:flagellar hook-associated protein 1 FlgK